MKKDLTEKRPARKIFSESSKRMRHLAERAERRDPQIAISMKKYQFNEKIPATLGCENINPKSLIYLSFNHMETPASEQL